jgi:hypothetical protein
VLTAGLAVATVDGDGDGMLDDWEIGYFGSSNATQAYRYLAAAHQ